MRSVRFVALCVGLCIVHLNTQAVRSADASVMAVVERLSSTVSALEAKFTSQEAKITSQEAKFTSQEATITSQGQKLTSQEDRIAHLEAENQRRVAFSVFVAVADAPGMSHVSDGEVVPFGAEISNVGHAFTNSTSVFTCPFPGEYFFAISLDVIKGFSTASLRKNGVVVVYADKDDVLATHISASAVLSLNAGDTVAVVQEYSRHGHIEFGRDCTFTGVLVK